MHFPGLRAVIQVQILGQDREEALLILKKKKKRRYTFNAPASIWYIAATQNDNWKKSK